MDFLGKKIEDFNSILQRGIKKYNPAKVLVGFTGGSDPVKFNAGCVSSHCI